MKTPMQELIKTFEEMRSPIDSKVDVDFAISLVKSMLEKERETICNAFSDAQHGAVESRWTAEEYFEEIFNNKLRTDPTPYP